MDRVIDKMLALADMYDYRSATIASVIVEANPTFHSSLIAQLSSAQVLAQAFADCAFHYQAGTKP